MSEMFLTNVIKKIISYCLSDISILPCRQMSEMFLTNVIKKIISYVYQALFSWRMLNMGSMSLIESFENETSRAAGGMHFPEVAIKTLNPAPLLPAKQQKYFYTTPDATIGISSNGLFDHLLEAEHTDNFEYGGPNRLGTQAAYLNIPHTVQRNLAPLVLPNAKESEYGNEPFALPFPHLQKGDIAFYLRLENDWESTPVQQSLRNPSMYDARTPLALVCRDWASAVHTRKKRKMEADEIGKSLMMSEGSQVFFHMMSTHFVSMILQPFLLTE